MIPDIAGRGEFPEPIRDLLPGQPISLGDLRWVALDDDYVPESIIKDPNAILGRVPTERLLAFEPIRPERLAAEPTPTPMPSDARPALSRGFESEGGCVAADMVMVIVSEKDLPAGAVITEEDLYAVQIAPACLVEGVFLSPVHVIGRTLCERILANEFVRAERLIDPETGACTLGPPRREGM